MRHIFSSFMICLSLCCAHTSVALAAQIGFTLSASSSVLRLFQSHTKVSSMISSAFH